MIVRRILVMALGLLLAACGSASTPAEATEPTPIPVPAVPAGWVTVASGAGDVSLTVPRDLTPLAPGDPTSILLQSTMVDGRTPIQIFAIGPAGLPDQPAAGESLRSWLERGSWVPMEGEGGVTDLDAVAERELRLPAGRGLEVATTVQPGTPDASRVIAYAIETAGGFAVLQILGHPDTVQARADELNVVVLLAAFGD
jgi:hypothetical protein